MTVQATHQVIDHCQSCTLQGPILLTLSIIQIVGVHHPNNMIELLCPSPTMVIPVQVFWFLQNCYICLQTKL
jgi:hypothetical protein